MLEQRASNCLWVSLSIQNCLRLGLSARVSPFPYPKPPQPLLAMSLSFLGLEVKSGPARSISLRECIEVANTSIAEWTHSAAMVVITPLSNPIATLQHLHLFSTTTTTTQWPPTIAMQCILAIQCILTMLTECLPHRQDIRIILLDNRITSSLRKSITELHRSLMPTETKQHGQTNPWNLTKAGRMKMTTPLKYTETLMLSKLHERFYHPLPKAFR